MRWAGRVSRMGKMRDLCNILIGKPEGKRPRCALLSFSIISCHIRY